MSARPNRPREGSASPSATAIGAQFTSSVGCCHWRRAPSTCATITGPFFFSSILSDHSPRRHRISAPWAGLKSKGITGPACSCTLHMQLRPILTTHHRVSPQSTTPAAETGLASVRVFSTNTARCPPHGTPYRTRPPLGPPPFLLSNSPLVLDPDFLMYPRVDRPRRSR